DLYDLPARTFVRLMALKDFVSGDARWRISGFECANWDGLKFCENQEAVSFLYAPEEVKTISDDGERIKAMQADDYNPYEKSFVTEPIPEFMAQAPVSLQYVLTVDEPDVESFHVTINRPGWVIFSEVMFPGWKAWVDGNSTALLTANHTFRAVWVP